MSVKPEEEYINLERIMEKIGTTSLWLGRTNSWEVLKQFEEVTYSEDGDFEGSDFSRAFRLGFYDENFQEAEFLNGNFDSVNELLKGFSYESVITPRFVKLIEPLSQDFNSVILIYDFSYSGIVQEWRQENIYFKFFGAVSYKPEGDLD